MNLSLQDISSNNYEAVCNLKVSAEQRNLLIIDETSSTDSLNKTAIIDSMFSETITTRAMFLEDTAVGFAMWDMQEPHKVSILCFMVGHEYQQQGIGHKAIELVMAELKLNREINEIETSYHVENHVAKGLSAKVGFTETGMADNSSAILASMKI